MSSMPDELIMLVMLKAAPIDGTMGVLRGFASARRRFQKIACGLSSKLFEEPVFVGARGTDRSASAAGPVLRVPDTIVDVARLAAKFGRRIERLHLGNVNFAVGASTVLWDVLCACPNLTHLSLAGASCSHTNLFYEKPFLPLAELADLPAGFEFSLPRLRHLDLSGLSLTSSALRRLLSACSNSLERLYLRNAEVRFGGLGCEAFMISGLSFPRLESLDVSGVSDFADAGKLRQLLRCLPALRDLYAVPRRGIRNEHPELEQLAQDARRSNRLLIYENLLDMDAASLRELRRHLDGMAYPRPTEARLDVPLLAGPFFLEAIVNVYMSRVLEAAKRLVSELGVSPLTARLQGAAASETWGWQWAIPPYFRSDFKLPEPLCEDPAGSSALHVLVVSCWRTSVHITEQDARGRTVLQIALSGGNESLQQAILDFAEQRGVPRERLVGPTRPEKRARTAPGS
eukprot:tig00020876_g14850.t1